MRTHFIYTISMLAILCLTNVVDAQTSGGAGQNAAPKSKTVAGVLDNRDSETGTVSMRTIPALVNNHYSPGFTYQVIVTVKEKGKTRFGFYVDIHDNANPFSKTHTHAPVGSVNITDPVNTQTFPATRSGGIAISQTENAGAANSEASFSFDWIAPESGIVNIELSGNAGDRQDLEEAADNVYAKHLQLSPAIPVASDPANMPVMFEILPVPAKDFSDLNADAQAGKEMTIGLYRESGGLVKSIQLQSADLEKASWRFSMDGIEPGIYLLTISGDKSSVTKRVMVK